MLAWYQNLDYLASILLIKPKIYIMTLAESPTKLLGKTVRSIRELSDGCISLEFTDGSSFWLNSSTILAPIVDCSDDNLLGNVITGIKFESTVSLDESFYTCYIKVDNDGQSSYQMFSIWLKGLSGKKEEMRINLKANPLHFVDAALPF